MPKYMLVTFNFKEREAPASLEQTLDNALDWVCYAPNCYILWTTSTEQQWHKRFKKILHEKDNFFVVEINIGSRSGWLPRSVWNWINEDRTKSD